MLKEELTVEETGMRPKTEELHRHFPPIVLKLSERGKDGVWRYGTAGTFLLYQRTKRTERGK